MQKTNFKLLGIVTIAVVAVCCTLMFSLFANAQNAGLTVSVKSYTDELGIADSEFTTDNPVTEKSVFTSQGDITDIPAGSTYQKGTSESGDLQLVIKDGTTSAVIKTLTFRTVDQTMYEKDVFLYVKQADGTFKELDNDPVAFHSNIEFRSICDNIELSDEDSLIFRALSPKEVGNISGRLCKYEEFIDGEWKELVLDNDRMYHLTTPTYTTNDFTVNASSRTISWKEYRIDQEYGKKYTRNRCVRFSLWAAGFDVIDLTATTFGKSAQPMTKITTDGGRINTNVALADYSIDGVKYSILTLDGLKENVVNNREYLIELLEELIGGEIPEAVLNYINQMSTTVFSLPSTLACVSGLESNCSSDIVIPEIIKIDGIGTFPVYGVLPGAFTGDKVETIELPTTLQVVFEDAMTELTSLQKLTFNGGGLLYLPDFRGNYDPDTRLFSNFEKLSMYLKTYPVQARLRAEYPTPADFETHFNEYLAENMPPQYNNYTKYKSLEKDLESIVVASAYPYKLVASQHFQTEEGSDAIPVIANDNNLNVAVKGFMNMIDELFNKELQSDSLTSSNKDYDIPNISMKGTFQKTNKFSTKIPGLDGTLMVGTGTISTRIVDRASGNPINGATFVFVDELGVEHTAVSDYRGVVTIDGLYQTAGFMNENIVEDTNLKFRSYKFSADNYKTVTYEENAEDGYLPIGCYTYTNTRGITSSDVTTTLPIPLTPLQEKNEKGFLASAANLNYVVDIAAASTVSGANAQCYEFNGSEAQQFNIELVDKYDNRDLYRIVNVNSNMVLDVCGGVATNYNNVQQYQWNGSNAQLWTIEQSGDFIVLHSAIDSNFVLDLNAGNAINGQNFQLYQSNDSPAQKFRLLHSNPAVPSGDFDLVDGIYEIHTAVNNDNVLDVQWGSEDDGANVWAYTYAQGNTNQQWKITNLGLGYYSIVNVNTGKALDVAGCGIIPGTNVWQYSYSKGNKAQVWSIMKNTDGSFRLVNAGSELALDIAGGSTDSQANVQGYFSNGTAAQNFNFVKVAN